MKSAGILLRMAALLAFVPLAGGCASSPEPEMAVAAAADENDGRENAQVTAGVSSVLAAAEAVFTELGITVTHRNVHENGRDIELHGSAGTEKVEIEIERHASAAITHVHVTVTRGTMRDEARAEAIMESIVRRLPKS